MTAATAASTALPAAAGVSAAPALAAVADAPVPAPPLIAIGGGRAPRPIGAVPGQPAAGFADVTDAVRWTQAQLWWDPSFDRASPRPGTVMLQADEGVRVIAVDDSLRVATTITDAGGARIAANESANTYRALDDRVLGVVDGLGWRLSEGRIARTLGESIPARTGFAAPVAVDGVSAEIEAAEAAADALRRAGTRRVALGVAGAVAVAGAVTGAILLARRDD